MDYRYCSVWEIIKRFIIGWGIAGVLLVVASCVKYHEFIGRTFSNNMWSLFHAIAPCIIIFLGIVYIVRSAFRI